MDWIGKHYVISTSKKSRVYTNCTMLSNKVEVYKRELMNYLLNELEGAELKINMDKLAYPSSTPFLPFVIKTYPGSSALSNILSVKNIGHNFKIEGPIGNGYGLQAGFSGKCVLISGGTGILPFVDLLDFLFKKQAYMSL